MTSATVSIEKSHYKMHVNSGGGNGLIADEPLDVGGQNLGFSPDELLCAALGACTAATLRMYADRKQWQINGIDVQVGFDRNALYGHTKMNRQITFHGHLTEEQKQKLTEIANKCPVHKTFSNPIEIDTIIQ